MLRAIIVVLVILVIVAVAVILIGQKINKNPPGQPTLFSVAGWLFSKSLEVAKGVMHLVGL